MGHGNKRVQSKACSGQTRRVSRALPLGLLRVTVVLAVAGVPLAINPWGINWFGAAKFALFCLAAACTFAAFAAEPGWVVRSARALSSARLLAPLLAMFGVGLLSMAVNSARQQAFFGSYPEYQGVGLWLIALVVGTGAVTLALVDTSPISLVSRASACTVSVVALIAVAQALGLSLLPGGRDSLARIGATLGNASNLGLYLVIVLPLVLLSVRAERVRSWRRVAAASFGLGLLALILTLSRGAWIGALSSGLVWVVAEGSEVNGAARRRLFIVAIGCLVALVAVGSLVPSVSSRIAALADFESGGTKWRAGVWAASLEIVQDRPLLGWGPNSFRVVYPRYRPENLRGARELERAVGDPHNIALSTAAACGIAGLVVLGALLLAFARAAVLAVRGSRPGELWAVALSSSLAGALLALQFHFLTLDAIAALATVAGLLAGTLARSSQLSEEPNRTARFAIRAVSGLVCTVLLVIAASLPLADASSAAASRMARAGDWEAAETLFERAEVFAPWEPQFAWEKARAAGESLQRSYDGEVWRAGLAAVQSAQRGIHSNPMLLLDDGRLHLLGGLETADADAFELAATRFSAAARLDPYNPAHWEGLGLARLASDDIVGAREAFAQALELNGRSVVALSGLGRVYDVLGDSVKAHQYLQRAQAAEAKLEAP